MKLLLDLQCVQSTSAVRGIGRYALALAGALVATAGPDDHVEVLLNGGDDPVRLQRARAALETFLPSRSVHVFEAPWPWHHDPSDARRREAELTRSATVAALRPDVLLVGSVFEGDKENVFSVEPGDVPTAAVLYDLIPAADPGTYLLGPAASSYWRRFEQLKRTDLLLSISEHSARQAHQLVGEGCPDTVPVWGGPYPSGLFAAFETRGVAATRPVVPDRYLLAVGGDHPRKNLDRLVQAWAQVPASARAGTALVVACRLNVGTVRRLRRLARRGGLGPAELVLTGEVSEDGLTDLYRGALGFVFPSTEEGLGLPPLEAMAAGCPTLLARGSSLSELVDDDEAYVDGLDPADMAQGLRRLLEQPAFRERLEQAAARSTARFTWEHTALASWRALRGLVGAHEPVLVEGDPPVVVDRAPTPDPDHGVHAGERELGLTGPLPPGTRTALVGATALVVPDEALARELVSSGVVEQALLPAPVPLHHDLYAAVRDRTDTARTAPTHDLVRALAFPPRWMLQRPWAVWLLLEPEAERQLDRAAPTAPDGAVLLRGGPGAVLLARSVDRVLVPADLLPRLQADLHRARCLGTEVTVLGGPGPTWTTSAADLPEALEAAPTRTTGWPWGG